MPAIFEGRFQNFDEIEKQDQYEDLNIVPRVYQHSLSRYQATHFFPEPISNEYNHIRDITSLCIALLCAEAQKVIHVLDIGGGFGIAYIELLKRGQLRNFYYSVCEINSFFQYYQENPFFKENNISILSSAERIQQPQQLIIFGSSLQYFSNTIETVKRFIQSSQFPKYILITHTPVTTFSSFVTTQVNMDNKKIPNWIFNVDDLIHIFFKNGYACIFKSAIYREGLFDDFSCGKMNYRSANFLFKKENEN